MAEYKLSSKSFNGSYARSSDYRFTVTSLDDPILAGTKKAISVNNAYIRKMRREYNKSDIGQIQRVHIMPRGPRKDNALKDYKYSRAYDSYLPKRYGTHFDVYVRQDMTAEYKMRREIDTGLTIGQQRKVDESEDRLNRVRWKERSDLQEQGIVYNWIQKTYTTKEVLNKDIEEKWSRN